MNIEININETPIIAKICKSAFTQMQGRDFMLLYEIITVKPVAQIKTTIGDFILICRLLDANAGDVLADPNVEIYKQDRLVKSHRHKFIKGV